MIAALVFLISLPLTVYTLSGCLELVDQPDAAGRFRALLRLSFRVMLFVLLTLLTPPPARIWILAAILTAIALQALGQFLIRYLIRSGRWPAERTD